MELPSPETARRVDVSVCVCVWVPPKKVPQLHTCQCFTWSCEENSISREQPPDPEHQQLYIRHIICIETTSVQQLHRGTYSCSNFTRFRLFHRTRCSLKPSFFPLRHVSCCSVTNALLPPEKWKHSLYIPLNISSAIRAWHFIQTWHPEGLRSLRFARQGSLTPRRVIAGGL